MTRALYQPVESFTRAGMFALVRRHGDAVRLRSFFAARRRRAVDLGAEPPMGNAVVAGGPWRDLNGLSVPEVMALLGTVPWTDRARAERCAVRVGRRSWAEVGVPVDDDLDINGRCLCGCGYVASRP